MAEHRRARPFVFAGSVAVTHAGAIAIGALLLTWPAIYNRFPLLYPDSISYLDDGRDVARALFLRQFSEHYGIRSLIYSLGILPFHWNANAWPVVALQCFLAAYVIWLVVRSIGMGGEHRIVWEYLVLMAALSVLTSLSWFACLIMPDVLGPLLYLCFYLLMFALKTLSRGERIGVGLIAWWAATSHLTHLMLAAGLCVVFVLLIPFPLFEMRGRLRGIGDAALVVLLAVVGQVGLNIYLYHRVSLCAEAPPYLMARIIGDGPGRWYLQQHCGEAKLALCDYADKLSDNGDDFLWGEHGVWPTASEEAKQRMSQEEMRFVQAAVRAYPRAELLQSARNFWRQLQAFGVYVFDANSWMSGNVENVLPGQGARYLRSFQAHDDLPLDFFSDAVNWTVAASLALIALLGILLRPHLQPPMAGLALIVFSAVIANAFVTAVFSNVEDRYQSRVMWLVPLLAGVLALAYLERRHGATPTVT